MWAGDVELRQAKVLRVVSWGLWGSASGRAHERLGLMLGDERHTRGVAHQRAESNAGRAERHRDGCIRPGFGSSERKRRGRVAYAFGDVRFDGQRDADRPRPEPALKVGGVFPHSGHERGHGEQDHRIAFGEHAPEHVIAGTRTAPAPPDEVPAIAGARGDGGEINEVVLSPAADLESARPDGARLQQQCVFDASELEAVRHASREEAPAFAGAPHRRLIGFPGWAVGGRGVNAAARWSTWVHAARRGCRRGFARRVRAGDVSPKRMPDWRNER
jgi:hypothetical protein